jgi:hypothetical protein
MKIFTLYVYTVVGGRFRASKVEEFQEPKPRPNHMSGSFVVVTKSYGTRANNFKNHRNI